MDNENVNEPPQDDTTSQPEQPETPPEQTPPSEQPPVTPEPQVEAEPEAQPAPEFTVDIAGYLKNGWALFTTDIPKFIIAVLITFLITMVTMGILSGPMLVGLFACFLKKARGGDFEIGDLFIGLQKQFLPSFILGIVFFAVMCVASFIPFLGALLTPVASFVIAPFFLYSLYEMAEAEETIEPGKLVDLVKSVYACIQPQLIMVMLWIFIAGIIGWAGFIACCIGMLITYPFAFLAITVSYMDIFKSEQVVLPQK